LCKKLKFFDDSRTNTFARCRAYYINISPEKKHDFHATAKVFLDKELELFSLFRSANEDVCIIFEKCCNDFFCSVKNFSYNGEEYFALKKT